MGDQGSRYIDTVINNLIKSPDGDRNNALYSASFTMGGLIASSSISETEAVKLLEDAACAMGLDEMEIKSTVNGGLASGKAMPLVISSAEATPLTENQLEIIEQKKSQARKAKQEKERTALQQLQSKRADLDYHRNLNGRTGYVKRKWGLTDDTISNFKVGYCHACPTSTYSDSVTIPYYQDQKLVNIRHRLGSPNGNGKYRPEMAGLPSSIFNIDLLDDGWVVLVEGEFKTMVLWQYGLPAVGIPGTSFKNEWLDTFSNVERVYVAFDPGAEIQALKASKKLTEGGVDNRIVKCPTKPDDFFVIHGGTVGDFCCLLESGQTYEQALRGDTQRWTNRYGGAFGKLRN